MEEHPERCFKCGRQQGLQGIALIIGTKTFHLFYLCDICGKADINELLKMIRQYKEGPTGLEKD